MISKKLSFFVIPIITLFVIGSLIRITFQDPFRKYLAQLKMALENRSVEELVLHIQECDIALLRLKVTIDLHSTNPEERFEARDAFLHITQEREVLQKILDKRGGYSYEGSYLRIG
jgi:hypothetical protein